jgi:UDP-N-acetylglucosamine acyltransferase
MEIHASAVVSPHAELSSGVRIGPYSIIGDHVKIGKDTDIGPHVVIEGSTVIGERNMIYPFVSIGSPPQDIGYRGEDTRVQIGNDNILREYCTINRGTTKQDWVTIVGNNNYFMTSSHVGHDCAVGNHVLLVNSATLGGHVVVGDYAYLGGLSAAHQFVRIGTYAFIGGLVGIAQDIPPYMIAAGARAKLYGPNQIGLRRHGFSSEVIQGLRKAYKIIWRDSSIFSEGIARVRKEMESFPELEILLDFIESSKRGIVRSE